MLKFLFTITYPTSLDALSNPSPTDNLENADANLDHDQQHSNANDAIEALEAKVGVDGSAVTTSHDYKLSEVTSTDKAVGKTATQTLTNKTLTSPIINLSSNATGDMYYRKSDGTLDRLPIGSATNIIQVSSGGVPEWAPNPNAVSKIDIQTFTSSGTWTKPTGAKLIKVIAIGGGGGGGGGGGSYSTQNRGGGGAGSGGGGGSVMIKEFQPTSLPDTAITITVGTGGNGGNGGTTSNSGTDGTNGGNSSFGTYVIGYGGNKGLKGAAGGLNGDGLDGVSADGVSSVVGIPLSTTALGLQGATGATATEYGGAGSTAGSIFGGCGGGLGGKPYSGMGSSDPKAAGLAGTYAKENGANNGTAGSTRETLNTPYCGGGGGGGTGITATVGCVGGAGSIGSGGGGGSGSGNGVSSGGTQSGFAGGAGGRGEVIVITYLG